MIWHWASLRYLSLSHPLNKYCRLFSPIQMYYKSYFNWFQKGTFFWASSYEELSKTNESCDPIVSKYNTILSNLSKRPNLILEEAVYETNFGFLRFDSDNTFESREIVHQPDAFDVNICNKEPFEPESIFFHKHKNKLVEPNQSLDTKQFNYFDQIYFENHVHISENSSSSSEQKSYKSKKTKKITDLSDVDFQYCGHFDLNTQNIPNKNSQILSADTSELNYLDSALMVNFEQTEIESENALELQDEKNCITPLDSIQSRFISLITNIPLFLFEESLDENSQSSIIKKKNYIQPCTSQSKTFDREALKRQLFELSDSITENIERRPHLNRHIKNEAAENIYPVAEHYEQEDIIDFPKILNYQETVDTPHEFSNELYTKTQPNKPAYDYVMEKRKQEHMNEFKQMKDILPNEKFKKILFSLPKLSQLTQYDMVQQLRKLVLYNANDIVAINKPYGIPFHEGSKKSDSIRFNIVDLLPHLAKLMREDQLIPCHRLDKNTTGIFLLAKTSSRAAEIKQMFQEQAIRKTYITIVKGISFLQNGLIDIPIGESKIGGYQRMALYPDEPEFRVHSTKGKKAITRYKVLSEANSCSLLEVMPLTGIKHQIRVHLGFGLGCPVLADHKYSFLTKIAPQKLPGDALEKLGLRQSLVRHLPLHLHALSVSLPGARENGEEIFIKVPPPKFFRTSIHILQLGKRKNRLGSVHSDIIYGYE